MPNPQQGFPSIATPFVTINDGIIEKSWLRFLISLWLRTGSGQGGTLFASGDIKYSGSSNTQDGWLVCDGAPVSRTDFANLFAAIGATWGAGDGTTTFNLPDFRDRTLVGVGSHPIGTYGGSATQTLSVPNLAPHTHTLLDPGHTHTIRASTAAGASGGDVPQGNGTGVVVESGVIGTSSTGISALNTGSGTPFSIMQPYAVVTALIKT